MSISIVFRYWNASVNDHFYTTNPQEIGTTTAGQVGSNGYTSEGDAFTVFNYAHPGLVAVYRYYHGGNHDHFYTANTGEIGATNPGQTGNHGYTCEGVLGYVSPHNFPGSVAIHRYYKGDTHDHFYTCNPNEIGATHAQGAVGNHGYTYEGVLGYAYVAQHNLTTVYRYYNDGNHDHFYTANAGEIGTTQAGHTGNHGYKSEGIAFHVFSFQHPGLVPVYRYYSGAQSDHFYTSNTGEIGVTQQGQTGNHGYSCEGVLGYVSPTEFFGSVPVYRYNHGGNHDHFYTTNAGEIGVTQQGQTGNHGYQSEGILGYVPHH